MYDDEKGKKLAEEMNSMIELISGKKGLAEIVPYSLTPKRGITFYFAARAKAEMLAHVFEDLVLIILEKESVSLFHLVKSGLRLKSEQNAVQFMLNWDDSKSKLAGQIMAVSNLRQTLK
eukprot:TRINITY_DN75115_c0_g1_i2.p1 TRINITY_DN75115_c0_g1~~TRINITY_DN75115_c0_g1_i2.p1  ORF type:complete len:139 (+),score=4.98 TRINITY_DN75115_c0_g1_i2:63-419(+)